MKKIHLVAMLAVGSAAASGALAQTGDTLAKVKASCSSTTEPPWVELHAVACSSNCSSTDTLSSAPYPLVPRNGGRSGATRPENHRRHTAKAGADRMPATRVRLQPR